MLEHRWGRGVRVTLGVVGLLLGMAAAAQSSGNPAWVVKPQWVRAHEQFLASDAMRGRGSATHDEELAATYVASEFEGYGLRPAPGMDGFLQSAEIEAPELDGHASLQALTGRVDLSQGPDFTLLISSGETATGPLLRVKAANAATATVPAGSVVLLTGINDPGQGLGAAELLGRSGTAAVLMPASAATAAMYTVMGGKTRVPVALKGAAAARVRGTVAALDRAAVAEFEAVHDGDTVTLTVHPVTPAKPRRTYNAIGYLPGTEAGAGTILLTAHLDHLGVGKPVNGDAIWNGANDDAAGTTAVLELAHALAAGPRLRRSVLFVCYGSEELGELGSTYFGQHPPVPLKSLVANLEFEMIGNQDPGMPKGVLLLTGWSRSNLGPELKAHGALLGPDPYPEEHFFERSDNYALALRGVVAHTAAGWGTPPTYHQPDDDLAHLNIPFMTAAIESLIGPMRWLADSSFVPQWNPGGQPHRGD